MIPKDSNLQCCNCYFNQSINQSINLSITNRSEEGLTFQRPALETLHSDQFALLINQIIQLLIQFISVKAQIMLTAISKEIARI